MKSKAPSINNKIGLVITALVLTLGAITAQGGEYEPFPASAAQQMPPQGDSTRYDTLIAKAQTHGRLRVITHLRTTYQAEGGLASAQEVQKQRATIAGLQNNLLASLAYDNVRSVKRFKYVPYLAMEVDSTALAKLQASPEVIDVFEDIPLPPALSESVPLIGADAGWAAGYAGAGQTIAILDTGIDKTHPLLAGKVVAEACFSSNFPTDTATSVCLDGAPELIDSDAGLPCSATGCDHGTHVAGIAAGHSGVAKEASLIAVQVFSQFSSAELCAQMGYPAPCVLTYTSDQLKGLEYVYELRSNFAIAAVNMSLGGGKFIAACDDNPLKFIIDNLRSAGIATIIASGNAGFIDGIGEPACISSAVSVGATDKFDGVGGFSNSADFLSLLAPGVAIHSSVPGGEFQSKNGTSMAAPHVAGVWAVLKSKAPEAGVDAILATLTTTGVPVTDYRNGITKPRIQVDRALAMLEEDSSVDPDPIPLTLLSPAGTITETTPPYRWSAAPEATWYYVLLQDSSGNPVAQGYVSPAEAGCGSGGTCAVSPAIVLTPGQGYHWWVAAGDDFGHYRWSDGQSFMIAR